MRFECGAARDARLIFGRDSQPIQVTVLKDSLLLAYRCDIWRMAVLVALLVVSVAVNALLLVAAGCDRLWSWAAGYLLSASVSVGVLTGATILMLP